MRRHLTSQAICCGEVHPILEEYQAGELDAGMQARIEAHLAMCSHCQHEMNIALEIGDVLRALPKSQPPPEVFEHIAAYVRSHPKRTRPGWLDWMKRTFAAWYRRPLPIGVAAICLVCLVLFGAYRQHQQAVQLEKATRELNEAFIIVRYAMHRTEIALSESLPVNQVMEAPRRALAHTMKEINTATSESISQAFSSSFAVLNKFNFWKEKNEP